MADSRGPGLIMFQSDLRRLQASRERTADGRVSVDAITPEWVDKHCPQVAEELREKGAQGARLEREVGSQALTGEARAKAFDVAFRRGVAWSQERMIAVLKACTLDRRTLTQVAADSRRHAVGLACLADPSVTPEAAKARLYDAEHAARKAQLDLRVPPRTSFERGGMSS